MPIDLPSSDNEALIATLYFSRDINSLLELGDFADGFVKLENLRSRLILSCLREGDRLLDAGFNIGEVVEILSTANHKLLQFHIGSAPWAKISATISFLSLMCSLVANYDKIVSNVPIIERDATALVSRINGATDEQRQRIQSGTRVIVNYVLLAQETMLTTLARDTSDIRKRLNGNNEATLLDAKIDVQGQSHN
jgi:hypothetical protein